MTPVDAGDLPPKVRRQVEEQARALPRNTAANTAEPRRKAREAVAIDRGPAYRCATCGEVFDHYGAPAERHADGHGGARLEAVLDR